MATKTGIQLFCDSCGEPIKNIGEAVLSWNRDENPDFKIIHNWEHSPDEVKQSRRDRCIDREHKYYRRLAYLLNRGGYHQCLALMKHCAASTDTAAALLNRLYGLSIRQGYNGDLPELI
jgi:hypothetical protein